MKRSDSIEYLVCENYMSALMNKDYSGLTDKELHQIKDFEYQVECDTPAGFEFGHFTYSSDYSEDFGLCEVSGLHARVVILTAIYWSKEA